MSNFLKIAFSKDIVSRALKVALLVGTLLNLINQYEAFICLNTEKLNFLKMFMTYSVPYLVSTYAGAMAIWRKE